MSCCWCVSRSGGAWRTYDQAHLQSGLQDRVTPKDLNLALGSAKALGLSLPNTASAQQLFSACVARGGAGWNHSAMVKALEVLADKEVGQT